MSQVSTEFQDIPVKQLGRNLDAAERLVALVSSSTDIQTRALLQEHLRYDIDFEMLYRVATRAFLATCLHVCSSRHNSPPWTDHCLGHRIGSLLAQLSFVDHCFGWPILPIQRSALPRLIGSGSW